MCDCLKKLSIQLLKRAEQVKEERDDHHTIGKVKEFYHQRYKLLKELSHMCHLADMIDLPEKQSIYDETYNGIY